MAKVCPRCYGPVKFVEGSHGTRDYYRCTQNIHGCPSGQRIELADVLEMQGHTTTRVSFWGQLTDTMKDWMNIDD